MVKITNGIDVFNVTRGAYESIFKKQGYNIIDDGKKSTEGHEGDHDDDTDEDAKALIEKPISQWTKNEVKSFIEKKGIDVTGITSFSEVKEKVKKYIEEM